MDDEFLEGLEIQFMNAAVDPAQWGRALDRVTQRTESVGVSLLTIDGRGPLVLATESIGELAQTYVSDGWYARDFRYNGMGLLKSRGFFTDQDIIPGPSLPKTAYYADFLEKFSVGWGMMLGIDTGAELLCLSLQRGTQTGPYQKREQAAVLPLAGIISRAAEMSRQLNYQRLRDDLDITEQIGDAAFYIDRFGRVAKMNRRGETMIRSGRLKLRDRRLSLTDTDNERLLRHIDAAIWPDLKATDDALRPVAVHQAGQPPLIFRALRIRGEIQSFFAPAHALLIVNDLAERRVSDVADLINILGLTKAEAILSQALMRTLNLVRAAQTVGVTHETARTQLKSVFAKTGSESQLELLRLLQALAQ